MDKVQPVPSGLFGPIGCSIAAAILQVILL